MLTEELLIHELAERAGISVRTIRYYTEEGLLPQPNYQGKYSYYSPSFLDRLELIRRLKESYLPLREIREIMNSLSDEEVKRKLQEPPSATPRFQEQAMPPQPNAKPGERALNYISQIMEDQTRYKLKGSADKEPIYNLQEELLVPESNSLHSFPTPASEETWQRIALAPGVELHIRRPLHPSLENRVRQLLSFSRKIFVTSYKEGRNETK
jgi:DNA-binding transcriptional MerR regulator